MTHDDCSHPHQVHFGVDETQLRKCHPEPVKMPVPAGKITTAVFVKFPANLVIISQKSIHVNCLQLQFLLTICSQPMTMVQILGLKQQIVFLCMLFIGACESGERFLGPKPLMRLQVVSAIVNDMV